MENVPYGGSPLILILGTSCGGLGEAYGGLPYERCIVWSVHRVVVHHKLRHMENGPKPACISSIDRF